MLEYCDWIAAMIKDKMIELFNTPEWHAGVPSVTGVGRIMWDLSEDGAFKSTKKTYRVQVNGEWYVITVEKE